MAGIDHGGAPGGTAAHRAPAGHSPERRSVLTGAVLPRDGMVRFVLGPDDTVVADVDETLPGRGLWLEARHDIVRAACEKGAFARAARRRVQAPERLADEVERQLLRRCAERLGLARRAGQLAVGFEAVRDWLRRGRAGVLITASDGAAGGAGKLRALAPDLPVLSALTSAELGRPLGRGMVVHAALAPGRLARALSRDVVRLAGFRGARAGNGSARKLEEERS